MHVERFNQARRLYDRLGFRQLADQVSMCCSNASRWPNASRAKRLAEYRLVTHRLARLGVGRLGRPDRDDKELKGAELRVLETVYALRQNRLKRAVE
jgi:hypothetical protein